MYERLLELRTLDSIIRTKFTINTPKIKINDQFEMTVTTEYISLGRVEDQEFKIIIN